MTAHDHLPGHTHGSLHPHGMEEPPVSKISGVPLVELANASNSYGATIALQDISLKIWPGQFLAIVGPNGGGKTTLLRTILGTAPVQQGKVLLRGKDPQRFSLERIGYVPQLETIDWNFPSPSKKSSRWVFLAGAVGFAASVTTSTACSRTSWRA